MKKYPWNAPRGSTKDAEVMGDFRSSIASNLWGRALCQVTKMEHPDLKETCYLDWMSKAPLEFLIFDAEDIKRVIKDGDPAWLEYISNAFVYLRQEPSKPFGVLVLRATKLSPKFLRVPVQGIVSDQHDLAIFTANIEDTSALWMRPDHPRLKK